MQGWPYTRHSIDHRPSEVPAARDVIAIGAISRCVYAAVESPSSVKAPIWLRPGAPGGEGGFVDLLQHLAGWADAVDWGFGLCPAGAASLCGDLVDSESCQS